MKKNIFVVLGLLIVALFLVGCAEKELSPEEQKTLESELSQMSDDQLDQVIEAGEANEGAAIAGQAYYRKYSAVPKRIVVNKALQEKLKRTDKTKLVARDKFKQILELAEEDTYCLNGYLFTPEPGEEILFCGMGGSIGGEPITDSYGCIATSFPEDLEDEACPEGSYMKSYGNNKQHYRCFYTTGDDVNNECLLDGYELVGEPVVIQEGYVGAGETYFNCGLDGMDEPWNYQDNNVPCGNSGAQMVGGGGEGYCCAYTE